MPGETNQALKLLARDLNQHRLISFGLPGKDKFQRLGNQVLGDAVTIGCNLPQCSAQLLHVPGYVVRPLKHLTQNAIIDISFALDINHLLAAGFKGVQLWDLEAQTVIRSFRDYTGVVCWQATVSANGKYVLAGFGDLSLWLWDFRSGKAVHELKAHSSAA